MLNKPRDIEIGYKALVHKRSVSSSFSPFSFHSSRISRENHREFDGFGLRNRRRLRIAAKTAMKPANNESPLALSVRTTYERTHVHTHAHPNTHREHAPRNGVGRGGGEGVCYRYRATWPRGDRDNASPPLLSARRFACFDPVPTYLPTYVTHVRIRRHRHHRLCVRSFRHAPLRPTGSYFCGDTAAFAKPKNCTRKKITACVNDRLRDNGAANNNGDNSNNVRRSIEQSERCVFLFGENVKEE